jgi:small-conductance mechanosensitive channel
MIPYEEDLKDVFRVVMESVNNIEFIEKEKSKGPFVIIEKFHPDKVEVKIYYWLNYFQHRGSVADLKNEVMEMVIKALREKGLFGGTKKA